MKKIILLSALLAAGTVTCAHADIKWNYVGGGYTDAGGDGPYAEASYRFHQNWVVKGTVSRLSEGPFDINYVRIGANYLTPFKLDFSPATQTYLAGGVDDISDDADYSGVYFGAGLRHPLTAVAELYTEATYHTIADNYFSLEGGIAFFISPDWALRSSIAANSGDTKNEFRIGVSYQF